MSRSPPSRGAKARAQAKAMPELVRRRRALERTLAKYRGRKFRPGSGDCVQLARTHLINMGVRRVPKPKPYRTVKAGKAELERLVSVLAASAAHQPSSQPGLATLLDLLLPEIAPAALLPGDVALVAAEPDTPLAELGSIVIALGGVKYAGWHPDSPVLAVIEIEAGKIDKAWRA